jgi:hypothetical protein
MVDEALDPTLERRLALVERRFLRGFGGGAVELAGEGGRRQGERVADDAGQPLVKIVLVGRLLERLIASNRISQNVRVDRKACALFVGSHPGLLRGKLDTLTGERRKFLVFPV